ncbi:MAG: phosphate propanoyltransferase [Treponema sp.]|jgi:propanediol utilization protein|nr:phosphate propanoyltransferase [Treponema sp.]
MDNINKEAIRAIVEQVAARLGLLDVPAAPSGAASPGSGPAGPAVCPAAAIRQGGGSGIPAEVSARHIHLTAGALEALFGPGAVLMEMRALSQPGEFLSDKRVRLAGPKGAIDHVAVLGPLRREIQAEVSVTDARTLGINPPLRVSGDLSRAADIDITGPAGTLCAKGAAIIARNHLHLRPADTGRYQVRNGDSVRVRVHTERPLVFEDVAVRVDDNFMPALHLDFDEANACMLKAGDRAEILSPSGAAAVTAAEPAIPAPELSKPALITEAEAKRMVQRSGEKIILPGGSILTPSAKDVFLHAHCIVEYTGRGGG